IKLNKDDEITLTDTKGILEYYKVANNVDGLDIKQDGNKLTIKATKVGQEVAVEKIIFKYAVDDSFPGLTYAPASLEYTRGTASGSQWGSATVEESQALLLTNIEDPAFFAINVEVEPTKDLEIVKYEKFNEKRTPLANVTFNLYEVVEGGENKHIGDYT